MEEGGRTEVVPESPTRPADDHPTGPPRGGRAPPCMRWPPPRTPTRHPHAPASLHRRSRATPSDRTISATRPTIAGQADLVTQRRICHRSPEGTRRPPPPAPRDASLSEKALLPPSFPPPLPRELRRAGGRRRGTAQRSAPVACTRATRGRADQNLTLLDFLSLI